MCGAPCAATAAAPRPPLFSHSSDGASLAMNSRNQFELLRQRRFAPFFCTQFLGAANDNVFKNAFVVYVAFSAAALTSVDAGMIVNLIGAIFIVPFVLLSAT